MKKATIYVVLALVLIAVASAVELIRVQPYETRTLRNLTSNVSLDVSGLERTYLYCTWHIDGEGEEAVKMDSNTCPETPKEHTFDDTEKYYVRIDYAKLRYNDSVWENIEMGNIDETYEYYFNVPEPPRTLLNNVYNSILDNVKNILCTIFPFLC